jgi:imidazolonepropionase-like amidohydrolase
VRRFIDLLVARDVALTPTLDLLGPGGFPSGPYRDPDPDMQFAPRAQRQRWEEMAAAMARAGGQSAATPPVPVPAPALAVSRAALDQQLRFLGDFHAAGGRLLAGTDTGVLRLIPGVALHNELRFLSEAGVDNLTVLHIATGRAAAALGRPGETGTLTPGSRADAVLLTADPLADIRNTRAIELVVKDGTVYRPDQLWAR